jgi:hypothetical protein
MRDFLLTCHINLFSLSNLLVIGLEVFCLLHTHEKFTSKTLFLVLYPGFNNNLWVFRNLLTINFVERVNIVIQGEQQ